MKPVDDPLEPKTYPGKYAIILIALLGIGAVLISQWYYYSIQSRALRMWGKTSAKLIATSPLAYAKVVQTGEQPVIDGEIEHLILGGKKEKLVFSPAKEISTAPGFSHLRQALVNNSGFDWSDPKSDCVPQWQYALEFSDGEDSATLLIAPNCRRIRLLDKDDAEATLQPLVISGLESFFLDHFPAVEKPAKKEPAK